MLSKVGTGGRPIAAAAVFRIWIRRFLGLSDPFVRGTDPETKIVRKPLFLLFHDFSSLKND
jgi:hypothetical protein